MSVKLNARQMNDVTVIDVSGRITLAEGTSVLRDAVRELITAGNRKVLLNLADVAYIDSSGIGELVSSYTTLKRAGGTLKLLSPPQRVLGLLEMTHVTAILDVHDDEAHALRSFA